MATACVTCGLEHVSGAGNELSHAQWEHIQSLNAGPAKATRCVGGKPPKKPEPRLSLEEYGERVGGVSSDWLDALEWVICHIEDDPLPAVMPGKQHQALWRQAKKAPEEFQAKYLPLLIRGRSVASSEVKWDGEGECPVCHREAEVKDSADELLEEAERRIIGDAIRVGKGAAPRLERECAVSPGGEAI